MASDERVRARVRACVGVQARGGTPPRFLSQVHGSVQSPNTAVPRLKPALWLEAETPAPTL